MDFEQVNGYLGHVSPALIMWVVGAMIVFFVILIVSFIWRRAVSSKVRKAEGFIGIGFGDVEKMRRSGMINDEEYKTIKRKVAERTLAESKERESGAEAQLILMQAAADPDIVRKLLPDEIQEKKPAAAKKEIPAEKSISPIGPMSPIGPIRPSPERKAPPEEAAGDPLAISAPGVPKPAMNMIRVAEEKAKSAGEEKGELDLLLEKGAITQDQYDKLKGYFKKPGAE